MGLRLSANIAAHLVFALVLGAIVALGAAAWVDEQGHLDTAERLRGRVEALAALETLGRAAALERIETGALAAETLTRFDRAVSQGRRTLRSLAQTLPERAPMLAEARAALDALARRFPDAFEAHALAERLRRSAQARLDGGGDARGALRALLGRDAEARRLGAQIRRGVDVFERSLLDATAVADPAGHPLERRLLLAGAAGLAVFLWVASYVLIRVRLLGPVDRLSAEIARLTGQGAGSAMGRGDLAALTEAVAGFRESAGTLRRQSVENAAEAAARREQIEALLQGLKLVNDADDVGEMHGGLLDILARLTPFDAAAILLEDEKGCFAPVAVSDPAFAPRLEAEEIGDAVVFDGPPRLLEACDYRLAARIKGFGYRSALVAALGAGKRRALILCARGEKDGFDDGALRAITAFAPVAEQALRGAEQLADLEIAVDDLDTRAHHCSLTGLKNRQAFIKEIERRSRAVAAWESGAALQEAGAEGAFALLHIDLDHFKAINDAVGHAAGDHALVWASETIRKTMRRRDFVARLGGDEFAVICDDDFETGELERLSERLVEELSRPFDYEGKTLQMGASIGIGRFPGDADDPGQILHIADMALLDAKADGRGRYAFFNSALRLEMERRRTLEQRLLGALEAGQISLWHQPIVDLKDRRVAGIEAQLRWECPRLGPIAPEEFLPVAEHAGLIGEIGAWALRQACADLGAWARAEPGRRIAIPVSAAQLSTPDFVSQLETVLHEASLRPHMLELLTETSVAIGRAAAMALENLAAARDRGCRIAFDHFGEGCASLEHLRPFAGHRVKLSPCFARPAEDGAEDAALAPGLVALAESLRFGVGARGVDREAHLRRIEALGGAEVQGELFGRAAPLKETLIRAERINEGRTRASALAGAPG